MKKLALNLDKLQVESFATREGRKPAAGTVRGNELATDWHCTALSGCCFTDWESCYGGCSDSGCGPGQLCQTE